MAVMVLVNDGSKDNGGRGNFVKFPTNEDITVEDAWKLVEVLRKSGRQCMVVDYA